MGGKSSSTPSSSAPRQPSAKERAAADDRAKYGAQFAQDRVAALTSTAETTSDALGTTLGSGLLGG